MHNTDNAHNRSNKDSNNSTNNIFETPYQFSKNEERINKQWKDEGIYRYSPNDGDKEKIFSIDTPPPTISGNLHMGHIFSYCHTDFIARYKRMKGFNVFYPMGFDDNGLPTEKLVEKRHKIHATHNNLEEYLLKCKQVSEEDRKTFKTLFEKVGLSVDWSLEYNTISPECQKISQLSFISLFQKGLIYIKESPILWDTIDQTTIAQAEVEEKEELTNMNYIDFQICESKEKITIATTRPELIPACSAILVHPEDSRYNHLNNQNTIIPICGRTAPILFDKDVIIEKGTGAVMCCTFGDEKDVEWQARYNLEKRIIINKYGKMIDLKNHIISDISNPKGNEYINKLSGSKIIDARRIIIEICNELQILQKQEEIIHIVKVAERSGSKLEIIETKQWYIKLLEFKEEFYKYSNQCNWFPNYMKNRIMQWIEGLKWDWCISRQRFSGIPIPVWYKKSTQEIIIAKQEELPVDPRISYPKMDLHNIQDTEDIIPCTDVLDTWATSSLTPNINAKTIHPTKIMDLRPQGHEIIRTWAFYTIAQSFLHNRQIPWKDIMLSGWCLSSNKEKMSKSKGNIIEPLHLLETFSADAVRYWAANTSVGADTIYSEETIKIGKKLINKIYNASKFILSLSTNKDYEYHKITTSMEYVSNKIDLWIILKLKKCIEFYEKSMNIYEYANAKNCIENFFTKDFCDNYIEIVKTRAYTIENTENKSAINTLFFVLLASLKAFAPFLPYITDTIYRYIHSYKSNIDHTHNSDNSNTILMNSIHTKGNWINLNNINLLESETQIESFGNAILEILKNTREWKTNRGISIKKMIDSITVKSNSNTMLSESLFDLKNCCNTNNIVLLKSDNNETDTGEIKISNIIFSE